MLWRRRGAVSRRGSVRRTQKEDYVNHELGGPVLVVHDDAALRDVITEALALDGVAATGVAHAEALGILNLPGGARPGLVLLDLDLGGDAAARVRTALARRHGGRVPVVGLSTAPRAALELGAPPDGTEAVLALPFALNELGAVVARVCRAN
jgi:CheY-like chemotaxis protein